MEEALFGIVVGMSGSMSSSSRLAKFEPFRELGREAEVEKVDVWWPPFLLLSFLMMSLILRKRSSLDMISFKRSLKSRCV